MNVSLASISCGPGIQCPPFVGILTVLMAFVVFVGSIYMMLAAVFGRRMGYLVLAVAFFGWMIIFSGLWITGYGAQGLQTQADLGPRGTSSHWQALGVGVKVASPRFPVVASYPGKPWVIPDTSPTSTDPRVASVSTVTSAIQDFLAARANQQLAKAGNPATVLSTDFTVTDIAFTSQGNVSLAAAKAYFSNGGPSVVVFAFHNSGSVPIYSWAFFIVSVLGFLIHLPFLDRAERKRKAVLTGGKQPQWLGPA